MKLTILCENTAGVPFSVIGEHGFACLVETRNGSYLFDTGQGLGIMNNASILGKDLSAIDALMISHGHYDHTGGLDKVLSVSGKTDIFAHPEIFTPRYWEKEGESRYIGIPFRQDYLESLGGTFRFSREMQKIDDKVFLTGEIPRNNEFETGDLNMVACPDGAKRIKPDPLPDDLSLVLDTDEGLVIVFGCAHAGMVNIIEHVMETFQRDRIHAVIGGTHLGFAGDRQFDETVRVLEKFNIERIGVSHCTGLAQASKLHARFGDAFFFANVGTVLEF